MRTKLELADIVAAKYPRMTLSTDIGDCWEWGASGIPLPPVPVVGRDLLPRSSLEPLSPKLWDLFMAEQMTLSTNSEVVWHARRGVHHWMTRGTSATEAVLLALLADEEK